ncbi:hypothetical protein [Acinetobacter bereziniae]|uniref:hypothetical protein n=1 Tax=Acinetobacter bereziniae TaxID=106648 RepID=UPI0020919FF6|nr:hypothetical protein [Acinetobacter bereziniae]
MRIFNKLFLSSILISLIISGCTNRDEISKVLSNNSDIPKGASSRDIKWYINREDVRMQIIKVCDSDTSKYSQRDDCQNAKGAEYAKLIQSNKDLSYDLRLNEDRKYLKEEMEKQKN